jgi:hypothetical protein
MATPIAASGRASAERRFCTGIALAILAIAQRRNPQTHKRWMLLATVKLVPAAIARWATELPGRPRGGLRVCLPPGPRHG